MSSGLLGAELTSRAQELLRARVPFVQATVVRAQHPTSAHAGDRALVHADGEVEGFVGGTCAETSVRVHALEVLVTGQPLLLRVVAGAAATTREEGAVTVANPCVSGGTVEVFLEPRRPAPRVVVVGDTPVAAALRALGAPLGLDVERDVEPAGGARRGDLEDRYDGVAAVVVASHGRGEEPALEAALLAGVPYIGLVASRARAASVLGSLGVDGAERVSSPAGLDIGAGTAPEIALSILAEVVASGALAAAPPPTNPADPTDPAERSAADTATALDPVCGMTVAVTPAALQAVVDDTICYFCGEHCRAAFTAEPERYAATG